MANLHLIFVAALILAYISEKNTQSVIGTGQIYSVWKDWAYVMLVTILVLYTGLRKNYNDTQNYLQGFKKAPSFAEFLMDPDNLNPFKNPLFYALQSFIKTFTSNGRVMIFLCSAFTQIVFLWFLKRYSSRFLFSVFLYFALGTFSVTMAAMKQVLAMAVLLLAVPYFERKQWARFYLLVFIAMLFHTYAIAFAVLPLTRKKPWSIFTYGFVLAVVVLMMNFEETITAFMDQANELGKTLEEYEVFHEHGMNIFRVAVYAVVPLLSFVFRKRLFAEKNVMIYTFIHMSLISMAFMIMGTQGGANMFGRMAHYFELGTICTLPWILNKVFDRRSDQIVSIVAICGFLGFFAYANGWIG